MAVTENNYTGNGSNTLFTFTFPIIAEADVKVSLDGVATTAFTLSNPTTVSMNSAPASNVAVRIFRSTDSSTQQATFFPGSAIKSNDLNNNFKQVLFVSQETENEATTATTTANTAKTTADSAATNATAAVSTANTASTNATNAVNTANTASTNATNAVNTANTASTNASTALSTANTASTTATTAATNASTALSTANTASTNATNAVSTANTASTNASTALSTANTANSTANTASTNASNAVTTANAASTTATAAQTAVANAVLYTPVANVAAIPGSPSDGDYVEVLDSTGIQSFSPLSGLPNGFVGASGLTVKLKYVTNSWVWQQYFATDSETRYINAGAAAIVNADVNASAAIAGSKISPDFGSQNVHTDGNINCGTALSVDGTNLPTGRFSGINRFGSLLIGSTSEAVTDARFSVDISNGNFTTSGLGTIGGGQFSENNTPTSGSGVEVFKPTSTAGQVQAYNRTGSAWMDLILKGATQQFHVSGTERMRLDSSGRLSVGTTTHVDPATILTVKNTASGSEHTFIDMICDTNETNRIRFSEDGSNFLGEIKYDTFTNFISFSTNSGERLRIDSTGRMGLGTSAPASKVHIVGEGTANGTTLNIVDSASNAASQHIRLLRGANQVTMGIEGSLTNDPFFLDRSASKRDFMIANNGDVGIGKVPTTKLDVNGSVTIGTVSGTNNNHNSAVLFQTSTGLIDGGSGLLYNPAEDALKVNGNTINSTTFSGSGNLGVLTCANGAGQYQFEAKNDALVFKAAGSERMRLGSSGYVSIGNSVATNHNDRVLQVGDTTRGATYLELRSSSTGTGGVVFSDGTANDVTGYRGNIEYNHSNDDMLFYTSSFPVMRLDGDGMCRIRGTTTSGSLNVFTSEGAATNKNLILGQHSANGVGGNGASLSFLVKTNGDVSNSNNSYGAISDINLKENIRDIESQWDDVKAVRLVKYEFKDKEAYGEGDRLGVIAQELEKISPSLVVDDIHTKTTGDESEEVTTKAVKYSVLTLKFMGALQEAMQRIEVLEQRLAELET